MQFGWDVLRAVLTSQATPVLPAESTVPSRIPHLSAFPFQLPNQRLESSLSISFSTKFLGPSQLESALLGTQKGVTLLPLPQQGSQVQLVPALKVLACLKGCWEGNGEWGWGGRTPGS